MADCLESYIKHWPIMITICEEHRSAIDNNISSIVNNLGIKRSAEELLQWLKPIAVALDSVQKDSCSIADAVEIWKKLETELALDSRDEKKKFKKRIDMALTPSHLLANIIHPKYRGKTLTDAEYEAGMEHASTKYSEIIPNLVNFKAKAPPFPQFMFQENVIQTVSPLDWWKSQADRLNQKTNEAVIQLLTATASSAGVE